MTELEIAPVDGQPPRQLVMLLHGVGGSGAQLEWLARRWAGDLPGTAFLLPDAPEPYDLNPAGRQWFSLRQMSEMDLYLNAKRVAPVLDEYIDASLARFGLSEDRLALVGFSQGTCMMLYVAPRRERRLAGALGYSGVHIGADLLPQEGRSRPEVLLLHGTQDTVVPAKYLPLTIQRFREVDIPIEYEIFEDLGHAINEEGATRGLAFLKQRLFGQSAVPTAANV